jgi:hypothetical protein
MTAGSRKYSSTISGNFCRLWVLKVWANSKPSVHFAATFKTFIKNIKTKKENDLYDDDVLHLSTSGTERMARILRNLTHLFYQERLTIRPIIRRDLHTLQG